MYNPKFYQKIEDKQDGIEISVFADCEKSSHLTVLVYADESQLPTGGFHIDDFNVIDTETNITATKKSAFDAAFREINYQAYQKIVNEYSAFRHRYNNYYHGL